MTNFRKNLKPAGKYSIIILALLMAVKPEVAAKAGNSGGVCGGKTPADRRIYGEGSARGRHPLCRKTAAGESRRSGEHTR